LLVGPARHRLPPGPPRRSGRPASPRARAGPVRTAATIGIATPDAELHRHGPGANHGEDVEELLPVRAMVLVVSVGHGQPLPAPEGPFQIGRLIIAVEGDGGGVVVPFVEEG
jgi:hypothetical protein